MSKIRYTYQQIHQLCEDLAESIEDANAVPKLIVGLARGGAIPAVILSHLLGVPCKMINFSSIAGNGDGQNDNIVDESLLQPHVLIVDDICDTGETLEELSRVFYEKGLAPETAVLIYKDIEASCHSPNYVGTIVKNGSWVVFPWEQK